MAEKHSILKEITKILYEGTKAVAPYIIAAEVYHKVFYHHTNTDPFLLFRHEDFPDLIHEKAEFKTSDGVMLTGYFYHYKKFNDYLRSWIWKWTQKIS